VNIYQKLAVATGVVLSFASIEAKSIQAATITYNYTETPFTAGSSYVSGSFSFDDSKSADGTKFEVTNFTMDWYRNQSKESLTAVFPYGNASNSILPQWDSSSDSLDGNYYAQGVRVSTNNVFSIDQTEHGSLSTPAGEILSSGSVSYTQVPEPSGVAGVLILGLGLLMKKKLASSLGTLSHRATTQDKQA